MQNFYKNIVAALFKFFREDKFSSEDKNFINKLRINKFLYTILFLKYQGIQKKHNVR